MMLVLAIAAGGGLGALARYYLAAAIPSDSFPWGILTVNVVGGFVMGLVVALGAQRFSYSPELRAFLVTGILGGFTTFSAFSLDTALLIERGDALNAGLYIVASVVLSVLALFAAMAAVRSLA